MDGLVEKVARAVCEANHVDPDKQDYWDQPLWISWKPSARAAIEAVFDAMAEPSVDAQFDAWLAGAKITGKDFNRAATQAVLAAAIATLRKQALG